MKQNEEEEKNKREQQEKTVRSKNENLEMVTLKKNLKVGNLELKL
jgi:hypothetical protein